MIAFERPASLAEIRLAVPHLAPKRVTDLLRDMRNEALVVVVGEVLRTDATLLKPTPRGRLLAVKPRGPGRKAKRKYTVAARRRDVGYGSEPVPALAMIWGPRA